MPEKWVFWFSDLGQKDSRLVGKKCANLGEMLKMGLRVPPGFALSLEAYRDFMSGTGALDEIKKYLAKSRPKNLKQFRRSSADIRRIVESKTIPDKIAKAIVSHYRELSRRCHNNDEVAVSVRSAGPASHPGQYESYLNVVGEPALLDKVRQVWASTFNPRSLVFRNRKKLPLESDPIGIAVQKMVDAYYSRPTVDLGNMAKTFVYCNKTIAKFLHKQAQNKSNVNLSIDNPSGNPIVRFLDAPVHVCDNIVSTESAVS